MKIAIVTDTHFGARSDSPLFNEYFFKFWDNVFFPYLENNKIDTILHLGDIVDRKKFINYVILNSVRTRFVNKIVKNNYTMYLLVGNHDVPVKNNNEINSFTELFGSYNNIKVVHKATTISLDGLDIAMIPWIHNENFRDTIDFIQKTPAQIAMGHLDLAGFEMDKGNVCKDGMSKEYFEKFESVYTGHFHHKSTDGHIFYLGNPYEITWADYNDRRGFHVLDTNTREVEFIENPYKLFHKTIYNDSAETLDSISNKDYSLYKECFVTVVVEKKTNFVLFEKFMEKLYEVNPYEIIVVENYSDSDVSEDDFIDKMDTTVDIIDKYIDKISIEGDKDKLKNLMHEIYKEAHSMDV